MVTITLIYAEIGGDVWIEDRRPPVGFDCDNCQKRPLQWPRQLFTPNERITEKLRGLLANVTIGMTQLRHTQDQLNAVGLSYEDVRDQGSNKEFAAGNGSVHVLVALPKVAPKGPSLEEFGGILVSGLRKWLDQRDESTPTYSLCEMDQEINYQLDQKLGLVEEILDVDEPEDHSILGYPWIKGMTEGHNNQRAGYKEYLRQQLKPLMDRRDFLLEDTHIPA